MDLGVVFFGFSTHYIIQMFQFLLGHLCRHGGFFSLGFLHTTSCRCSGFAWDIYPDMGVGFFRISAHYIIQMLQLFLGQLHRYGGCFFSGFLHTTSCRCSRFSLDIYPDTGVVIFRFSGHYIMQMLRVFLGHLPRHCGLFFLGFVHPADALESLHFCGPFTQTEVVIFGLSTHYIMQMLRTFLGHLPGHQGCSFGVFRTVLRHVLHFYLCVTYLFRTLTHEIICLHHADAPDFLRTSTQTPCFWVFCTSPGHVLNGVWVNVGENMLFSFRIFTHQCIMQMLWKFRIVPGHLYGHQGCFCRMFHTSL